MFRSLASRLLLTYLLVTTVVIALAGVSLVLLLSSTALADRLAWQALETEIDALAPRMERALRQGQAGELATGRLGQRLRSRALVINAEGDVIVRGGVGTLAGVERALTEAALMQGQGQGEIRDSLNRRWFFAARRLSTGELLVVAAPRPALRALLAYADELITPLWQAGLVGLLVSVVLAWLMSRWVTAPLRHLAGAARSVAAGHYEQPVPLGGPVEVKSLAADFNRMVERVRATQQGQRDFVANVSHELRTPLTSIDGFAQAILDGTATDDEAQRHAAQVIHEESSRLARLVDDLLDLARLDAGQMAFHPSALDVNALVARVADRLSLHAGEKGIRLENEVAGLPAISGDGDRLSQVFTNLLDNAIKNTPPGGHVRLRGEVAAGALCVHVEDSGPGIPAEDLPRIFERFYQVDKARRGGAGRGTGLGLAISHEIVQAHGGQLTVTSTPGRGSCFTVRIPLDSSVVSTVTRRRA